MGRVWTGSRPSLQFHSQVPGLGPQVSGSDLQDQVRDCPHPHLNPNTRTRLPIAETRDPKIICTLPPLPTRQLVNWPASCRLLPPWPTGQPVNRSTNAASAHRVTTSASYARLRHNRPGKRNREQSPNRLGGRRSDRRSSRTRAASWRCRTTP